MEFKKRAWHMFAKRSGAVAVSVILAFGGVPAAAVADVLYEDTESGQTSEPLFSADGNPDVSSEVARDNPQGQTGLLEEPQEESLGECVVRVAKMLRDAADAGTDGAGTLDALWNMLAAVPVFEAQTAGEASEEDIETEALHALQGLASTKRGIAHAYALVVTELGYECGEELGDDSRVVVVVGTDRLEVNPALGEPGDDWRAASRIDGSAGSGGTEDGGASDIEGDSTDVSAGAPTVGESGGTDTAEAPDTESAEPEDELLRVQAISLTPGSRRSLSASTGLKIYPNLSSTGWKSSDSSIVEIVERDTWDCVVRAVKEGTATITFSCTTYETRHYDYQTTYDSWTIEVKADTYTIRYNANGGTGAPAAQTKRDGVSIRLSTQVPTKSGYAFVGWSRSSSATAASYDPGDYFSLNEDCVLFAVWRRNIDISSATVSAISSSNYTGYAITPTPTITYNGSTLVKDRDYRLSYSDNVSCGTGWLTVTGIGDYTGSTRVAFSIQPVEIKNVTRTSIQDPMS